MSRKPRKSQRKRLDTMAKVKAAKTIEQSAKQPKAPNKFIKSPVHIFEDGEWKIVEESNYKFPHPINMTITPDWCLDVLTYKNELNRRVRQDRVDKYMQDVLKGNFEVINNGIGFYKDGTLADGQHRLWAIVEAQQEVDVIVVFGMNKSSLPHIDEGASRSTKDVANMMGIEGGNKHLGVSNYILEVKGIKRTTPKHEQIDFYRRHSRSIMFVCSRLNRKMIARSPVLAACTRAYYSADHDRLERFLEILQDGYLKSEDESAAIMLRNFLLQNNNNSGSFRLEMYYKTEMALKHFLDYNTIKRLYRASTEQFPLPEDNCSITTISG